MSLSSKLASKIVTREELLARREIARREGRAVVQCHGCFDIVHPGHVRHLRQARSHGDVLLVSITGDESYQKRGGSPLIPQELRAENLAELDCVDWVFIDPDPTALQLLESVRPDVYVKGREYETNNDPRFQAERDAVESHGGRVVFSSGDVVFSSTALIGAMEASIDPYHTRFKQLLETPALDGPTLTGLISAFRGKRVLVIGESILDTYVHCDQPDVASESPVLTLRPLERRTYDGGAAVIARQIATMGGRPTLLTALPVSLQGHAMAQRLIGEGVDVQSLEIDVPVAEKQRFLVGAQKVMKLNNLSPLVLDAKAQDELVERAMVDGYDAAVIADFGNGLLSPGVVSRLTAGLRPRVGTLTGDVSGRRSALMHFRGMDLLCPSERELREATRRFDESIPTAVYDLLEQTQSRAAMVTMGPEGLIAFDRLEQATETAGFATRLKSEHVPAMAGFAVDPLGCGDSLLSAATLTLASGGTLLQAAFLGSISAAAQAQRLGNVPVTASELRHGVVRAHTARLAFAPSTGARPGHPLAVGA